jgi:hypothetical protein
MFIAYSISVRAAEEQFYFPNISESIQDNSCRPPCYWESWQKYQCGPVKVLDPNTGNVITIQHCEYVPTQYCVC